MASWLQFASTRAATAGEAVEGGHGWFVVGELLANAVLYGTAPIEVALSAYPGMLVGTVADHGVELPYMRVAEPGDEHGRGLAIVDGLAHKWGVRLLPDGRGKCVWFVCLIPSEWLDLAARG